MGAPTIGGDTSGAIDQGGVSITGDLDDVGFVTGNNDDTFTITTGATYGTATINASTGQWTYQLDNSDPTVSGLAPGDTLTDIFTVRMLDTSGSGEGQTDTADITITITGVICFCSKTLIETVDGLRPAGTLRVGDAVPTADGAQRTIRWVGRRMLTKPMLSANPNLFPVRISAGSLGGGRPQRDLLVSRQHRMLIRSKGVERRFGEAEVLIPAIRLTALPGIYVDDRIDTLEYVHLLFDQHEIIFAEGAACESLFPGPMAFSMLDEDAQRELQSKFPELWANSADARPARRIVQGREAKDFICDYVDGVLPI